MPAAARPMRLPSMPARRASGAHAALCAALAVAVAVDLPDAGAAHAAVLLCKPAVGGLGTGANEGMAKRAALGAWIKKAEALGPGFTRWQLARSRSLACQRGATGFGCAAYAEPCRILQAPPPPSAPRPSPRPQVPHRSIET